MTTVLDSDLANGDLSAGSFTPNQVFIQGPFQSDSVTVLSGLNLAKWTVIGLNSAGKAVAWDPAATNPDVDAFATGAITFTGQPTADDTITINGHVITWKASGAIANQVNVGGSAAASAANLLALINAAPLTYLVTASGTGLVLALQATTAGTSGNAITLTESTANLTVSGATLSGGDTGFTVPALEATVFGVLAQAVDATSGDVKGPAFLTGTFQHDALVWPVAIDTLAERQRSCVGSKLWVSNLK